MFTRNKIIIVLIFFFVSCMPSRIVRPLKKDQKVIDFSLGGPLIGFGGKTIPMPLSSINYAQGLTERFTGFANLHTTSLLFGILQTDIGGCYGLYYNDSLNFGISATPALNFATDLRENNYRLWPQLDVNVYYEFNPNKSFVYLGINNWFELNSIRAHDQPQKNRWLISPQIGYRYSRTKWEYNFETKYLVPYLNNEPNVVDYKSIGEKGSIGIYFTIIKKL